MDCTVSSGSQIIGGTPHKRRNLLHRVPAKRERNQKERKNLGLSSLFVLRMRNDTKMKLVIRCDAPYMKCVLILHTYFSVRLGEA